MIPHLDVAYATQYTDCPDPDTMQSWVNAALTGKKGNYSLTIKVVDESEMTQLNFQYRQKNKPTNVLSFACQLPAPLRGDMLGDIAICAPIVVKEANESQKSVTAHWAHLVIHGVLHLLGHDHEREEDAVIMEALETKILQDLGFPDPYRMEISHE
ncbi:MAG: rRNA maturation RNase YbeY [Candidatus Berkiellales bacterium]